MIISKANKIRKILPTEVLTSNYDKKILPRTDFIHHMKYLPKTPWSLTGVTAPFILQSKDVGASQVTTELLRVSLRWSHRTGLFTFPKYLSLNSSLLKSLNQFRPILNPIRFELLSTNFIFRLKFSKSFNDSSACSYNFPFFALHCWKSSIIRLSDCKSSGSNPTMEYWTGSLVQQWHGKKIREYQRRWWTGLWIPIGEWWRMSLGLNKMVYYIAILIWFGEHLNCSICFFPYHYHKFC